MAATYHGFVVVPTPGVAVPLASGPNPVAATFVSVYPREVAGVTNVGEVRLGGGPGSIPQGSGAPINPGDAAVVWPNSGTYWDLREIYVDADNANDGVQFLFGVV